MNTYLNLRSVLLLISMLYVAAVYSQTISRYGTMEVSQNGKPVVRGLVNKIYEIATQLESQRRGKGFYYHYKKITYVITCDHIVRSAAITQEGIYIKINGELHELELVGGYTMWDIAVLKFKKKPRLKLKTLKFAMELNINPQITIDIDGRKKRGNITKTIDDEDNPYGTNGWFEHDIVTEKGISGMPILQNGNIVGIANHKKGNVSYMLDGRLAKKAIHDIIDYGHVIRPWLGFMARKIQVDNLDTVLKIEPISPDVLKKFENEDINFARYHLYTVGGKRVCTVNELAEIFARLITPKQKIELTFRHDDDKSTFVTVSLDVTQLQTANYEYIARHFFKNHPEYRLKKYKSRWCVEKVKTGKTLPLEFAGMRTNDRDSGIKYIIGGRVDVGIILHIALLRGRMTMWMAKNTAWTVWTPDVKNRNSKPWYYF